MRENKYKVWDKERKTWLKNTGNPYIFPFNGKVAMKCIGDSTGYITDEDYSEFYDIVWFTGLKDKNGVEIYEGDFVRNNRYDNSGKFIGDDWIVKYGEHDVTGNDYYSNYAEGFYFENKSNTETYNIIRLPYDRDKGIEVIGNIHEHPELLK